MLNGELQAYLQRFVLKGVNVDPDLIPDAINLALLEIQRGMQFVVAGQIVTIQHDWSAMADNIVQPYRTNGIALESSVTRVRAVYRSRIDPTTNTAMRGQRIISTSMEARDNDQGHGVSPCESWWMDARRVKIGRNGCELVTDQATDVKYWIDYFAMLPPLLEVSAENWFTCHAWDAIAYLAASIAFQSEFDPQKIQFFEAKAIDKIKTAINADIRLSAGGVSEDVVPDAPDWFGDVQGRNSNNWRRR